MAFLWMAAFVAIPLSAAPASDGAPRREVQVTVTSTTGAEDVGLANALAQALIDTGLQATRFHEGGSDCERCLRVTVRQVAAAQYVVRARSRDGASETTVQIEGVASTFDQAHALAIEVESLSERVKAEQPHVARRSPIVTHEKSTPILPVAPSAPSASTPSTAVSAQDTLAPTAEAPRAAPSPVVTPERLYLDVAATVQLGTSGDLFMQGVMIGLRTDLGSRFDIRASIALLRPQNVNQPVNSYHREVFPVRLVATLVAPKLDGLRLGAGVEGLSISDDIAGQEPPPSWAIGPLVWIEYRHAFRGFSLFSGAHAAYHPDEWTVRGDSPRPSPYPPWTLGASVGLEFGMF